MQATNKVSMSVHWDPPHHHCQRYSSQPSTAQASLLPRCCQHRWLALVCM